VLFSLLLRQFRMRADTRMQVHRIGSAPTPTAGSARSTTNLPNTTISLRRPRRIQRPALGGFNNLPLADMAPITIMGHKVYGVFIEPGMGLRQDDAKGTAVDDQAEENIGS